MPRKQRGIKITMSVIYNNLCKIIASHVIDDNSVFILRYSGRKELDKKFIIEEVNDFLIKREKDGGVSLLIPKILKGDKSKTHVCEKFSFDRYGQDWAICKEELETTIQVVKIYTYRRYIKEAEKAKIDLFDDSNNHPELGHPSYKQIINDVQNITFPFLIPETKVYWESFKEEKNTNRIIAYLDWLLETYNTHPQHY